MNALLITNPEELVQWEPAYSRLLGGVGGIASLYYSLDCIQTSAAFFRSLGGRFFFILVVDGEDIIAVLPLQLVADGIFGLRRTVKFWGEFDVYTRNYHPRILADGFCPEAMDAAVCLLKGGLKSRWDVIGFNWLPMEDRNLRHFVAAFSGAQVLSSDGKLYYYDSQLDLDVHLGKSRLQNLRRRCRRLEEHYGKVEFRVSDEIAASDLEEIAHMHTERHVYKETNGDFFSDPLQKAYAEKLFGVCSSRRCLRYYAMHVQGKLVAFDIVFRVDGIAFVFVGAFDIEYAKYSPSRFVAYESFRHEIREGGVRRIENGCDSEPDCQKLDYSTHDTELFNVAITNTCRRSRIALWTIDVLFRVRRGFANRSARPEAGTENE